MQLSLLLVDDNPIFLRILTRFLSEQNEIELEVVGSVVGGRDAVARAAQLQPEAILLDLSMPDVSGLELLPQLRATMPDTVLIALTSLDPAGYREAALAAGADAFVSKGSVERDLLPAIARAALLRPRCGAGVRRPR